MRKITRNDINKNNMVALSSGQCQTILSMFASDYKIGYNEGVYGWNYDLYEINGVDIVAGYRIPYKSSENKEVKKALIALENKVREMAGAEAWNNFDQLKKDFFNCL